VVTEGIILVNALVYLAGMIGRYSGAFDEETFMLWGHFEPQQFRVWQLITTQFMHDPSGLWHIAFNMLFLWVFGAAVENRLGRIGFAAFYLVGGAVAALGHMIVSEVPVIGASGAVAAVTGAFLALFPRSRIVLLFLLGGAIISIPSLWFIGFYFCIDLLNQTVSLLGSARGGVAYMAHLAGYVYGFGVAFVLLATGVVTRGDCDVFYLYRQARRRAAMRAATRGTAAGAWESAAADTGKRLADNAASTASPTPQQQQILDLRAEINRLAAAHDLPEAASRYRTLLDQAPDSVFHEQRQLELANQLYLQQDHQHAAAAYELLLDRYPAISGAAEVRLILGMLYARRLERPQRAAELIGSARPLLRDAAQTALADELLAELRT
jgi:membrane associated rhomboid family serine protease